MGFGEQIKRIRLAMTADIEKILKSRIENETDLINPDNDPDNLIIKKQ